MIARKGDNDDPVDTDIELDTNVEVKTELSTSDSVTGPLTENPDEKVDTEEEMDFDEWTITGNYSDYDILEEEKETINKNDNVWVKNKKYIWRGRVLLISYIKKEDSEHLKIKWTDSRKEDSILIKNVLLNYSKKEVRCLLNSSLMVHTWRKLYMITPPKPDKENINNMY